MSDTDGDARGYARAARGVAERRATGRYHVGRAAAPAARQTGQIATASVRTTMAAKPTASTDQSIAMPGCGSATRTRSDRHERRRRDGYDARNQRACNRGQCDLRQHDRGPAPPDHAEPGEGDAVARRRLHLASENLTDGDDDRDRRQQREQRECDRLRPDRALDPSRLLRLIRGEESAARLRVPPGDRLPRSR